MAGLTGDLSSVGESVPILGQVLGAGLLSRDCRLLNQYAPSPPSLLVIKCTSFIVQCPFMLLISLLRTDFKGLGLLKCAAAEISRTTEV